MYTPVSDQWGWPQIPSPAYHYPSQHTQHAFQPIDTPPEPTWMAERPTETPATPAMPAMPPGVGCRRRRDTPYPTPLAPLQLPHASVGRAASNDSLATSWSGHEGLRTPASRCKSRTRTRSKSLVLDTSDRDRDARLQEMMSSLESGSYAIMAVRIPSPRRLRVRFRLEHDMDENWE